MGNKMKKNQYTQKCIQCGTCFTTCYPNQRACSKECRRAYDKQYAPGWERWRHKDKTPRHCPICGVEFIPRDSRHRFCSAICNRQERKKLNIPDASVREYFLEMYNYQCAHCKIQPERLTDLHLHHIKPLFKGGDDSMDNITILCARCHRLEHNINE